MTKQRYKITLEYLGKNFCGWQRQKNSLSIQQIVEEAIYQFSKEHVILYAAGRTDSGVHACGQVAHFDLNESYNPYKIMQAINHFMRPHSIGVIDSEKVSADFHARFSVKQRHYIYRILNRGAVNIINSGLKSWIKEPLNIENMQLGANYLIGKHDFSSFRSVECQSNSPIKTMSKIQIVQEGENIDVSFSALSFLHHMVRNIMGNLLMVGKGKWAPEKIKEILELKDRTKAGPTAPPEGLYFSKVEY